MAQTKPQDVAVKAFAPALRKHCKSVKFSHKRKSILLDFGETIPDLPEEAQEIIKQFKDAGYKVFTQMVIEW